MIKLLDIAKEILNEDRCKRIADRKYDKPSAYKSGAIVRCRKGNIWKSIKEELTPVNYYKQLSDLIIQKLPKVKPGFIRLWRGNRPNEVKKNPSYTTSLEGIALPFYYGYYEDGQNAVLTYIDIPQENVDKYTVPGGVKGEEVMIPKELLNNVEIVDKNIYKSFEDQNLSQTGIPIGGLSSFDDFADSLFKEYVLNEAKKETLRTWFKRKGAPGKTGGWVDCNTCREVDGKKKCKPCGRKKGETRAKYPSCRPTPSQCSDPGKGKSWGKTK